MNPTMTQEVIMKNVATDSRWSLAQVAQGSNAHRHTVRRAVRVEQVRIRMMRSAGLTVWGAAS